MMLDKKATRLYSSRGFGCGKLVKANQRSTLIQTTGWLVCTSNPIDPSAQVHCLVVPSKRHRPSDVCCFPICGFLASCSIQSDPIQSGPIQSGPVRSEHAPGYRLRWGRSTAERGTLSSRVSRALPQHECGWCCSPELWSRLA